MPQVYTSDHHSLMFCKSIYRVRNYHGIAFRLKEAPDFELEQTAGSGASPLRFVWLERGLSRGLLPEGSLAGGDTGPDQPACDVAFAPRFSAGIRYFEQR